MKLTKIFIALIKLYNIKKIYLNTRLSLNRKDDWLSTEVHFRDFCGLTPFMEMPSMNPLRQPQACLNELPQLKTPSPPATNIS